MTNGHKPHSTMIDANNPTHKIAELINVQSKRYV
jgi:hypothetical protein